MTMISYNLWPEPKFFPSQWMVCDAQIDSIPQRPLEPSGDSTSHKTYTTRLCMHMCALYDGTCMIHDHTCV